MAKASLLPVSPRRERRDHELVVPERTADIFQQSVGRRASYMRLDNKVALVTGAGTGIVAISPKLPFSWPRTPFRSSRGRVLWWTAP
jgi:hypothetical protein